MPEQPELFHCRDEPMRAGETLRSVVLGDRNVPYVLRRSRRRTVGLAIGERGLCVGAPSRASIDDIESLLLRHGEWVARKLDEWRLRQREPLLLADGTRLGVLGRAVELHLAPGNNRALWDDAATPPALRLYLPTPQDAARILEAALRRRALAHFAERLAHFAAGMGLPLPRLSLTAARTRWGSCSLKSGIRLNWRLVHFPLPVIDYVVVHELAHLREMNHSPRFWAIVEGICPDYRNLRRELKKLAAHCPRW